MNNKNVREKVSINFLEEEQDDSSDNQFNKKVDLSSSDEEQDNSNNDQGRKIQRKELDHNNFYKSSNKGFWGNIEDQKIQQKNIRYDAFEENSNKGFWGNVEDQKIQQKNIKYDAFEESSNKGFLSNEMIDISSSEEEIILTGNLKKYNKGALWGIKESELEVLTKDSKSEIKLLKIDSKKFFYKKKNKNTNEEKGMNTQKKYGLETPKYYGSVTFSNGHEYFVTSEIPNLTTGNINCSFGDREEMLSNFGKMHIADISVYNKDRFPWIGIGAKGNKRNIFTCLSMFVIALDTEGMDPRKIEEEKEMNTAIEIEINRIRDKEENYADKTYSLLKDDGVFNDPNMTKENFTKFYAKGLKEGLNIYDEKRATI